MCVFGAWRAALTIVAGVLATGGALDARRLLSGVMALLSTRCTAGMEEEMMEEEEEKVYPPLPPKRKFGTVLSNTTGVGRVSGVGKRKAPGDKDADKSRYYHQYQYTPRFGIQSSLDVSITQEKFVKTVEPNDWDKENVDPALEATRSTDATSRVDTADQESTWNHYASSQTGSTMPDSSIWITSLEELTDIVNALPSWKYRAIASECEPLKRFYSLPVFTMPSDCPEASEFVVDWSSPVKSEDGGKSSAAVEPRKGFSLSAQSPSFVPHDSFSGEEPSSELLQVIKSSGPNKKVAPHMDWWPGDWKCKKCGNHVSICPLRISFDKMFTWLLCFHSMRWPELFLPVRVKILFGMLLQRR